MDYLCELCCKLKGIFFIGMAENAVGRKHCSECGDNAPDRLHILPPEIE